MRIIFKLLLLLHVTEHLHELFQNLCQLFQNDYTKCIAHMSLNISTNNGMSAESIPHRKH